MIWDQDVEHWPHATETPLWSGDSNSWQLQYFSMFNCEKSWCYIWFNTLFWSVHLKYYQDQILPNVQHRYKLDLSMADAEILIHAFVSSRLEYCTTLFLSLPIENTKSLHKIQIATAWVLTRTRKCEPITQIPAHCIGSQFIPEQTLRCCWWSA